MKKQADRFIKKIKAIRGDPHDIALGMGLGVFVAITPTIPFHTVIALFLAVSFRASKTAAMIGVWVCNPFTALFFYIACYKVGLLFFENATGGMQAVHILIEHLEGDATILEKINYLKVFLKTQMHLFFIMNVGGLILGAPSGAAAYFLTRTALNAKHKRNQRKAP